MIAITIIKYLFSLIGLVMLGSAVWLYLNTQSFLDGSVYAEGEVIDLVRTASSDSYSYRPTVSFKDHTGKTIEFTNAIGSNPPSYAVGELVDVLYQTDNPNDAKIDGFFSLWFLPSLFAGMGLIFFSIGFTFFASDIFSRRKAEHLRMMGMSVKANIRDIQQNTSYTVNGRHPYRIYADWKNPLTGESHSFKSSNIWSDPSTLLPSDHVTVFVDKDNPKKYHMDTSFLPDKNQSV